MDTTKKIQYLLDRFEIQDTIMRYAIGQDSHQGDDRNILEQWKDVFTEDAVLDYSVTGVEPCSYQELALSMRGDEKTKGRMNATFSKWQHLLGVPTIVINGDTATARTDLWATHKGLEKGPNRPFSVYTADVFHDQLVRTEKGWRIKHRRIELHFLDTIETTGLPENLNEIKVS